MNIKIIAVGGLKEKFLREAQNEFLKRLSRFCKINVIEIDECPAPKPYNRELIARSLEREAEKILEKCERSIIAALCVEGEKLTSEGFAKLIKSRENSGVQSLAFVVGSSHGLADSVKISAAHRLSFSDMTFPHQLFRIMLLEQLYRAYDINGARRYDK